MVWTDFSLGDPAWDAFGLLHGIHPLHLEDCRSDEQQAKIEAAPGYLFVVLKLVILKHDELTTTDLDVFLGRDYIATVHKSPAPAIAQFSSKPDSPEPGEAFYLILDSVVDSYLPILEQIEDRIDLLEDRVVRQPNQELLGQIADFSPLFSIFAAYLPTLAASPFHFVETTRLSSPINCNPSSPISTIIWNATLPPPATNANASKACSTFITPAWPPETMKPPASSLLWAPSVCPPSSSRRFSE